MKGDWQSDEFWASRDFLRLKRNCEGCGAFGGSSRVWLQGAECQGWHRISRAVPFQGDWAGLNNEHPCDAHEIP